MDTPATFPCRALAKSGSGSSATSLESTSAIAYPKAFFDFLIPCAVTTTSFKVAVSVFIVTLITVWPSTKTSTVS